MPVSTMNASPLYMVDPYRQFDWTIDIDGFGENLSLSVAVAFLPNLSVEEIELPFRNSRTWVAGKGNVETGSITVKDTIQYSIGDLIYDWYTSVYDPITGKIGFTSEYKRTASLYVLDSKGEYKQWWFIRGLWPTTVNFGTIDYSSNDVIQIEMTCRYDRAERASA